MIKGGFFLLSNNVSVIGAKKREGFSCFEIFLKRVCFTLLAGASRF